METKVYSARVHVSYSGGAQVYQRVAKFTLRAKGYDYRDEDYHR